MEIAFIYTLISSLVITAASLVGVIFLSDKLGKWAHENLKYLVSFSSGIFLVIAIHLGLEAIEIIDNILLALGTILIGSLILYIVSILFPEVHHHHEEEELSDGENHYRSARGVLWGDAVHNFADGIIIGPAFLVNPTIGILTTLGILIHELAQEVSEYFLLVRSGYSSKDALLRNLISSSTVIIGAIVGFFIASLEIWSGILLGIASGVFLFILCTDLIPASVKSSHAEKDYLRYFLWTLAGIALIFLLNSMVQRAGLGEHGHEEDNVLENNTSEIAH